MLKLCSSTVTGGSYSCLNNEEGNIRFRDGGRRNHTWGRGEMTYTGDVEVCHNNQWGAVCADQEWSSSNAYMTIHVVCRLLGFTKGWYLESSTIMDVPGRLIWLVNLSCDGHENNITDCAHGQWGGECIPYNGAVYKFTNVGCLQIGKSLSLSLPLSSFLPL